MPRCVVQTAALIQGQNALTMSKVFKVAWIVRKAVPGTNLRKFNRRHTSFAPPRLRAGVRTLCGY